MSDDLYQVITEGHPECSHPYIFYWDNGISEQGFKCDVLACGREEYLPPDHEKQRKPKMVLPPNAYLRTTNVFEGGPRTYTYQADENGVVHNVLPRDQWKLKTDVDLESILNT